jgi:hypothetical protein
LTGIENKGEVACQEPLNDTANRVLVKAEINNGGRDRRCVDSLESACDGVCNIYHRAAGAKGLLQVERNERFIFNYENVLASKHPTPAP